MKTNKMYIIDEIIYDAYKIPAAVGLYKTDLFSSILTMKYYTIKELKEVIKELEEGIKSKEIITNFSLVENKLSVKTFRTVALKPEQIEVLLRNNVERTIDISNTVFGEFMKMLDYNGEVFDSKDYTPLTRMNISKYSGNVKIEKCNGEIITLDSLTEEDMNLGLKYYYYKPKDDIKRKDSLNNIQIKNNEVEIEVLNKNLMMEYRNACTRIGDRVTISPIMPLGVILYYKKFEVMYEILLELIDKYSRQQNKNKCGLGFTYSSRIDTSYSNFSDVTDSNDNFDITRLMFKLENVPKGGLIELKNNREKYNQLFTNIFILANNELNTATCMEDLIDKYHRAKEIKKNLLKTKLILECFSETSISIDKRKVLSLYNSYQGIESNDKISICYYARIN